MIQILLAILAGVLTIGAPCILPVLPILLGTSVNQQSKTRPLFITLGFVLVFCITGLFLSIIINQLRLNPDLLRNIAIVILGVFGLFMLWPLPFEKLTQGMNGLINKANQTAAEAGDGNLGGFVLGCVLGIIWTPCAGPVLGSILTLIATQKNLVEAGILLFAYSVGAGIPMLLIAYGSQWATTKIRSVAKYSVAIQKIFGILIIATALLFYFRYDLILKLAASYGGLTSKY